MLHRKNIQFFVASLVLMVGFYLYNPFALYFQSDDFIHINWSRQGIFFQDNAFRPVCDLSIMFDHFLYGKNAWGYHLTNLILHIIASILVGIFYAVFVKKFLTQDTPLRMQGFICGTIFFIYSSHSEAVFWILGRSAILGAIFSLLFLIGYLNKTKHPFYVLLYIFSWLLALMSYESCWVLPIYILLFTLFKKEKHVWKHFFVVCMIFLLYLIFRYVTIHQIIGEYEAENIFSNEWKVLSLHYLIMISRSFLPWFKGNRIAFYGLIILSIFLILFLKKVNKKERKTFMFLGLLFLLSLLPYISIGVDTNGVEGERFLYFPIVFLCLLITGISSTSRVEILYKETWLLTFSIIHLAILAVNSNNQQFAGAVVKKTLKEIAHMNPENKIKVYGLPQCQYGALIFRAGLPDAVSWLINKEQGKNIHIFSQRSEILPLSYDYPIKNLTKENSKVSIFNFKDSELEISEDTTLH
ncbi:MAG: hypothetical protein JSS67_10990 [Bacteroidetes bacterium]|nr:hypothetical protein [Bacteroidota bacterium]